VLAELPLRTRATQVHLDGAVTGIVRQDRRNCVRPRLVDVHRESLTGLRMSTGTFLYTGLD
jgi:hypothetical protein